MIKGMRATKKEIVYPESVERVYGDMYRAGTYQGERAAKASIYRIMVDAGIIDQLGNIKAPVTNRHEIQATVIHELKQICYMNNFYYYADPKPFNARKLAYYGVRYLSMHKRVFNPLTIEVDYGYHILVLEAIRQLTPRELMRVLPIDKEYDGESWGCKDYYSTMAGPVERNGIDKPISDPYEFLSDYVNHDARSFLVHFMSVSRDISVLMGNGDPIINAFESVGMEVTKFNNEEK